MITTTLLVSTDPSLIIQAGRLHDARAEWRLEVCGRADKARAALARDDIGLVIIDLVAVPDAAEAQLLLEALPRGHTAAVVSAGPGGGERVEVVAGAVAAGCDVLRPGLAGLAHLLDATARQRRPGTTGGVLPATAAMRQDPFYGYFDDDTGEELRQLRQVVGQDTTVLLTGETGTGKTLLARRIHELSPRRDEPFLVVDCGALSASLIESEMFGHVRGAFTGADRDRTGKFAAAGSGTLVLDEINSLHPSLQSKLLRAVEERVFEPVGSNKSVPLRARLVAVSNTPLQREVDRGRFRPDLYYRLNVVGFELPPLRERRGAVAPLAAAFLAEFAARSGRAVTRLAAEALGALERYDWPGNVRELRNAVERGVVFAAVPTVQFSDLPRELRSDSNPPAPTPPHFDGGKVSEPESEAEQREWQQIAAALHKHRNNRRQTASELGISRVTLYKKIRKYELGLKNELQRPGSPERAGESPDGPKGRRQ